jgi:hypothetical protein
VLTSSSFPSEISSTNHGCDVDCVALGLSHERGEAFKTVFLTCDKANTGAVTTKQLEALCFALGAELDPEEGPNHDLPGSICVHIRMARAGLGPSYYPVK